MLIAINQDSTYPHLHASTKKLRLNFSEYNTCCMLTNRSCSDAARQPGTRAAGDAPHLSARQRPALPTSTRGSRGWGLGRAHPHLPPCPITDHGHPCLPPAQGTPEGRCPPPLQTLPGDAPTSPRHAVGALRPQLAPSGDSRALDPTSQPARPPHTSPTHAPMPSRRGCEAGAARPTQPPGRGEQSFAPWDTTTDHLSPAGNCPTDPRGPSYGDMRLAIPREY